MQTITFDFNTGYELYLMRFDALDRVFNTVSEAYETPVAVNAANYKVALSEGETFNDETRYAGAIADASETAGTGPYEDRVYAIGYGRIASRDVKLAEHALIASEESTAVNAKLSTERLALIDGGMQTADYVAPDNAGIAAARAAAESVDARLTDTRASRLDLIGNVDVTFVSPVAADGTLTIVQGDDYTMAAGKQLQWRVENWAGANLAGATMTLALIPTAAYNAGDNTPALAVEGAAELSGTTAMFTAELTAAQTAALESSPPEGFYNYQYQVRVETAAGQRLTIVTNAVHAEPGVGE